MIFTPIQLIIAFFALFSVILTIIYFKNDKIGLTGFLSFSFIWICIIIFALFPYVLSKIATYMGLTRGVDLLIYPSIALLFLFFFKMNAKLERIDQENGRIIGELAILRSEFEKKYNKKK